MPRVLLKLLPALLAIQPLAVAQERGDVLNARQGAVLRMDDGSSRALVPGASLWVVATAGDRIRVRTWDHLLRSNDEAGARHIYPFSYACGSISPSMTMSPWLAVVCFSDLISKAPDDSALMLARSFAYTCIEEYDKALVDAKRASTAAPKDPNSLTNLAVVQCLKARSLDAVSTCNKAIGICPTFGPAVMQRAWAYSQLKQFDKAIADCDALLQLQPDCVEALIERANFHHKKREYEAEVPDLSKALNLSPVPEQAMKAFFRRGRVRAHRGESEAALEDYKAALEQEARVLQKGEPLLSVENVRNRSMILGYMAVPLMRMGDLDRAFRHATDAIEIDGRNMTAWMFRGQVLVGQNKLDQAMTNFDQAIRVDPRVSTIRLFRGLLKHAKSDFDGALEDIGIAIDVAQDDIERRDAYMWRADTWCKKGRYVEAESDLSRAIALQPNDARLYSQRAVVWEKLGNSTNAAADEKRARELKDAE